MNYDVNFFVYLGKSRLCSLSLPSKPPFLSIFFTSVVLLYCNNFYWSTIIKWIDPGMTIIKERSGRYCYSRKALWMNLDGGLRYFIPSMMLKAFINHTVWNHLSFIFSRPSSFIFSSYFFHFSFSIFHHFFCSFIPSNIEFAHHLATYFRATTNIVHLKKKRIKK